MPKSSLKKIEGALRSFKETRALCRGRPEKTKPMASYHLTVRAGAKGKAAPHADYISRNGNYSKASRYEDLVASDYGNMPTWAAHNPTHLWDASDHFERANGSSYREIEIALPRELNHSQQRALVESFIQQELGEQHAYQWAIHCPKAALEKGDQPHAHIMYCERINDGIQRDPEHYFKRYNKKVPERGGCRKMSGGSPSKRREQLIALRGRWADLQNQHLEKHGYHVRVDHRKLSEQGIDRVAETHLGGAGVRRLTQSDISDLLAWRHAEFEQIKRAADADQIISRSTDVNAAIREQHAREKTQNDTLTVWALAAKIKQLTLPPLDQQIAQQPAYKIAKNEQQTLVDSLDFQKRQFFKSVDDVQRWRNEHPLQKRLHDTGVKTAPYIRQQEQIQHACQLEKWRLEPLIEASTQTLEEVEKQLTKTLEAERAPQQAQINALQKQLAAYRAINLDRLLTSQGIRLIRNTLSTVEIDAQRRELHIPPVDPYDYEILGRQVLEGYSALATALKTGLSDKDKPIYQKSLLSALGEITGLLKTLAVDKSNKIAKMAQRDAEKALALSKQPVKSRSRTRYRSRSDDLER